MAADDAGRVAAPAGWPEICAGVPVLAAKITAPGVPDWAVPRPRITKLIAEGTRRGPLTIVTGPPGAGKTMALTLWAAEPGTVAWISVDDFDNQPGAFWSYAVAALGRSGVAFPEVLPAASRRRAAGHLFLLRFASALAAQNPPVTLAVDDLHVLTNPTVLTELDFVLRNARPGLRVVVSFRVDPLVPFVEITASLDPAVERRVQRKRLPEHQQLARFVGAALFLRSWPGQAGLLGSRRLQR